MRQNGVDVDIAVWKYVNLLSIRELFYCYFTDVSGSHGVEATEEKKKKTLFLKINIHIK